MAFAFPQGPPKAANPKVPAATVPHKPHAAVHAEQSAHAGPPKTKFQNLIEQLTQVKHAETDKAKVKPKAESVPASLEKPKEAKKAEHKETKADAWEMANLAVPVKIEALKPKVETGEQVQASLDKAKNTARDRRLEANAPMPVTQASAEVAKLQAQQHASRAERQEERPKVFVVDRRTEVKEKEKLKLPGAEGSAQQPVGQAELQAQQTKVSDPKAPAADVQVVFQTGAKGKEGFELKPQNTPVSSRDAATFQQYLVDKGYGQLVDQARIVLKDQNAGEIRMTLYPESLGKVKVNLNLSDNSLAGQIFVENQTVKEVFQSNMDGMMQAFRDGGWNNLSLEVSVGNGSGGQTPEQQSQNAAPARDYGRQVTQTNTAAPTERIGSWNGQINLTA